MIYPVLTVKPLDYIPKNLRSNSCIRNQAYTNNGNINLAEGSALGSSELPTA